MSDMDDASRQRNFYSVKDVCAIIKTGSSCGVSLLKLGDLHIEFVPKAGLAEKFSQASASTIPSLEGAISDDQMKKQSELVSDQEEYNFRKQQLSLSFIEDPELAERLLADGELEDDDSAGDDD